MDKSERNPNILAYQADLVAGLFDDCMDCFILYKLGDLVGMFSSQKEAASHNEEGIDSFIRRPSDDVVDVPTPLWIGDKDE
ncbi:MAG TPA: hypothetical protein VLH19_00415 [Patescibacteria group bacterium]|nr:hypothetical protein [Patescibacteria group bacterium]